MNKIFLLFILSVSVKSFSYYGAVTTGTAGSGRAAIETTEAPVLNPAALAYMNGYVFTSGYSTLSDGNLFAVSFTDNLPDTTIPSTLLYYKANRPGIETQSLRFSSGNFMMDRFAVGIGFLHHIDALRTMTHAQTNMYIGTLFTLAPDLGLGVVVENIIESDSMVPLAYRLMPKTSMGISYNYQKVARFKLDIETPSTSHSMTYPIISGGVETYWNRWLIVRFGGRKSTETNIEELAGGLGFVGPKFALQYGYTHSPQDYRLTRHAIDLAIPIW